MKKQDKQEINNPEPVIEDLTVNEAHAAEVKGGPQCVTVTDVDGVSTYQLCGE